MSLTEAPIDIILRVIAIESGEQTKRKLSSMGIQIDNTLIKLNNTRWGPVLIKNQDNGVYRLALGRKLAEKIRVSYAD